jgi:hypothetical protein
MADADGDVREILDEVGAGNKYLSPTNHLLAILIAEIMALRQDLVRYRQLDGKKV